MSVLLEDFGTQDTNWKNNKNIVQQENTTTAMNTTTTASTQSSSSSSRLAPHGKAPIHISIESFGYTHGAPSRPQSYTIHTHPLPPFDCREICDPVPKHLDYHDGLHSGVVKRILKQPSQLVVNENDEEDDGDGRRYRDLQEYAQAYIATQCIWPALLEAQTVHGYANPLIMTIQIGSNLGRHRSVVVVEWVAIQIRKMLRKQQEQSQDNASQIHQPVSVGTVHRDLEKRVKTAKKFLDDDDD